MYFISVLGIDWKVPKFPKTSYYGKIRRVAFLLGAIFPFLPLSWVWRGRIFMAVSGFSRKQRTLTDGLAWCQGSFSFSSLQKTQPASHFPIFKQLESLNHVLLDQNFIVVFITGIPWTVSWSLWTYLRIKVFNAQNKYARLQKKKKTAAAKSLQSCPTLCNPIDSSPPGFSVPGILQARTLEWVAISFSSACMDAKSLLNIPKCNCF